jgi:hypothetical protein
MGGGAGGQSVTGRLHLRNMLDAKQEVSMVYMFEFFTVEPDGNRLLLEITKHRAKTKDLAHAHGESMMHNVLFGDQKATVCIIKDQTGNTLGEMLAGEVLAAA